VVGALTDSAHGLVASGAFLLTNSVVSAVFSLNVPVSGRVRRLANELYPELVSFDRIRDRHTLVLKRFGENLFEHPHRESTHHVATLKREVRPIAESTEPFSIRLTHIDTFDVPTDGSAPVVYLAVESEGLWDLHYRLTDAFGAVPRLEADEYTPHVTLARDGEQSVADRLCEREIEPIEWTVSRLGIYDARFRESAGEIPLGG